MEKDQKDWQSQSLLSSFLAAAVKKNDAQEIDQVIGRWVMPDHVRVGAILMAATDKSYEAFKYLLEDTAHKIATTEHHFAIAGAAWTKTIELSQDDKKLAKAVAKFEKRLTKAGKSYAIPK